MICGRGVSKVRAGKMKEARVATIHAQYRFVDGYHVFTSEEVRGLYVASKDAREAYDSVGPVLEELLALKLKTPCEIEPAMSFDQFMASIEACKTAPDVPMRADREFIVRLAS